MDTEKLVEEVAAEQKAIDGQTQDTRKRVLTMGQKLKRLQKWQKGEQKKAKERGESTQPWKEWCEETKVRSSHFPHPRMASYYTLIATYPKAYEPGMSIKEAYKQAGKWKANAGNPPLVEKVTIKARPLITLSAGLGKLNGKMEKILESDLSKDAEEQEWTEDEILGATDELTLMRQGCNAMLRMLKDLHASI